MNEERHVTRRRLLISGAALAGLALLEHTRSGRGLQAVAATITPPQAGSQLLFGAVTRHHVDGGLELAGPKGSRYILKMGENAQVFRNGKASLNDFEPGDEVIAEGTWDKSVFRGTTLMLIYRTLQGKIASRRGNLITVGGQEVDLTGASARPSDTYGAADVARLGPGDDVALMGHHSHGKFRAVAVSGGANG